MHMNLSPSLDGDGFIDTVAKPDIIIIIIILHSLSARDFSYLCVEMTVS